MASYQHRGCSLYARFTFAILGVLLGFMGCLCFAVVYKNYYCSAWAMVSGVLALLTFVMHLMVWKDVTYSTSPLMFTWLKIVGTVGSVVGCGVFIGFLIKGIMEHETGIEIHGWFIVTVWGWMTWKWGFLLFWYAKNYSIGLHQAQSELLPINEEDFNA